MSESTTIHPRPAARVLTSAWTVASITGLPRAELYQAHTVEMGSPGHFLYVVGGLCYTRLGLGYLADGLEQRGHAAGARMLRAEIARQDRQAGAEAAAESAPRWDLAHEARQEEAA